MYQLIQLKYKVSSIRWPWCLAYAYYKVIQIFLEHVQCALACLVHP